MPKLHMNARGEIAACNANERACPLGDANHFNSLEEAAQASAQTKGEPDFQDEAAYTLDLMRENYLLEDEDIAAIRERLPERATPRQVRAFTRAYLSEKGEAAAWRMPESLRPFYKREHDGSYDFKEGSALVHFMEQEGLTPAERAAIPAKARYELGIALMKLADPKFNEAAWASSPLRGLMEQYMPKTHALLEGEAVGKAWARELFLDGD